MRIDAQYGADTGMALVDVYLESDREVSLSHREVWAELRTLLAVQGVDLADVVDFFLHRQGPSEKWVSVGVLSWDAR